MNRQRGKPGPPGEEEHGQRPGRAVVLGRSWGRKESGGLVSGGAPKGHSWGPAGGEQEEAEGLGRQSPTGPAGRKGEGLGASKGHLRINIHIPSCLHGPGHPAPCKGCRLEQGGEGVFLDTQDPGCILKGPSLQGGRQTGTQLPPSRHLGLALGSPIFPSGCEGKLGVALESPQGRRDLT